MVIILWGGFMKILDISNHPENYCPNCRKLMKYQNTVFYPDKEEGYHEYFCTLCCQKFTFDFKGDPRNSKLDFYSKSKSRVKP